MKIKLQMAWCRIVIMSQYRGIRLYHFLVLVVSFLLQFTDQVLQDRFSRNSILVGFIMSGSALSLTLIVHKYAILTLVTNQMVHLVFIVHLLQDFLLMNLLAVQIVKQRLGLARTATENHFLFVRMNYVVQKIITLSLFHDEAHFSLTILIKLLCLLWMELLIAIAVGIHIRNSFRLSRHIKYVNWLSWLLICFRDLQLLLVKDDTIE